MDWLPETNNTLLLDWKDGVPRFVRDIRRGPALKLEFGCERYDDVFISNTSFIIGLSLQNEKWSARIVDVWARKPWEHQKTQVNVLIEKINEALQARSNMDLTVYVVDWLNQDPSFSVAIWW